LNPDQKTTSILLLETAGKLFARKGFAGTSIRDIATEAEVNVAAVNYHFKTKENLYAEVFRHNWNKLDHNIIALAHNFKDSTLHKLSYEMFLLFMSSEVALANSFKVILTDEITLPNDFMFAQSLENFGPPGGAALLEHVTRTIGDEISQEVRLWVVEVVFSYIAHIALISSANSLKDLKEISQICSIEVQKKFIYHLVEATLLYAKSNPTPWDMPD
jgi:AcrR family transcriptional regulator